MRSTPDPSLRGLTTDLLKSLDERNRLHPVSLPSGSRGIFQRHGILAPEDKEPDEAQSSHRLAILYHKRKNYEKAERLYQETLTILGLTRGTMDTTVGQLLNNVARLYVETGWYGEAEPLLIRSLEIARHHFGTSSSKVARRLANLAELCVETERYDDALKYFQKAISIETRELGAEHGQTMSTMRACAALLRRMDRQGEAEPIERMFHRERKPERRSTANRRLVKDVANRPAGRNSAGERRRRAERRSSHSRRASEVAAKAAS